MKLTRQKSKDITFAECVLQKRITQKMSINTERLSNKMDQIKIQQVIRAKQTIPR